MHTITVKVQSYARPSFTAQIGDKMKRLLIAVNKAVAAGNMVMFGGDMKTIRELAKRDHIDENMIVDKKSQSMICI